jgi:Ca2+/H+ antiporter, TMEM165/GDT1 family
MMDWKLIATTFGVIFLAELGDKTQIAAMTMSASSQKPLSVFIGASLALAAVSAVGVAVGAGLSEVVPLAVVRKVSAALFVVIGIAMLLDWI